MMRKCQVRFLRGLGAAMPPGYLAITRDPITAFSTKRRFPSHRHLPRVPFTAATSWAASFTIIVGKLPNAHRLVVDSIGTMTDLSPISTERRTANNGINDDGISAYYTQISTKDAVDAQ